MRTLLALFAAAVTCSSRAESPEETTRPGDDDASRSSASAPAKLPARVDPPRAPQRPVCIGEGWCAESQRPFASEATALWSAAGMLVLGSGDHGNTRGLTYWSGRDWEHFSTATSILDIDGSSPARVFALSEDGIFQYSAEGWVRRPRPCREPLRLAVDAKKLWVLCGSGLVGSADEGAHWRHAPGELPEARGKNWSWTDLWSDGEGSVYLTSQIDRYDLRKDAGAVLRHRDGRFERLPPPAGHERWPAALRVDGRGPGSLHVLHRAGHARNIALWSALVQRGRAISRRP